MKLPRTLLAGLILFQSLSTSEGAELSMPDIFGDHMVLQRDRPIILWGRAAPGESLSIDLADQSVTTTAATDGTWEAQLPALPAGGPHILRVRGNTTLAFQNVLIGEVWLASGQSNMEWLLKETDGASEEIARSRNPNVRMIKVARAVSAEPMESIEGLWRECDPTTSGWFSAVGYYFAKTLAEDLSIPVGIINSSRGSAQIQPWIPRPEFLSQPALKEDWEKWEKAVSAFPAAQERYAKALTQWEEKASTPPSQADLRSKPQPPFGPGHYNEPGGLFNGMVAPLARLSIRGVLWYQGEANSRRAAAYRGAFPILISSWRKAWKDPEMPFLFVQIAPYAAGDFVPSGPERAELRDAQAAALDLPATGMVVTLDIGGPEEHPRNKRDVGLRLARLAEAKVYGLDVPYSGPVFERADFVEDRVLLHFAHSETLRTLDGNPPTGFEICGSEGTFFPAEATLQENTVVLTAGEVPLPVGVRYAWCNLPQVNLVNGENLPAVPFRTTKP